MDVRYWRGALASLARNVRTTDGFARDLATSGLRRDAGPSAPVVHLLDAYPAVEELAVDMGEVAYRRSNLDPMEQYALAALAALRRPRRVLELGTYDGATTLLLARNAPAAEIITIDLPAADAAAATVATEADNVRGGVGARFRDTPEAARITQLLGDSRSFDFSPWFGTVDLVLVDAGHTYDCVAADTQTALRVLAPGGLVIWDDYQEGWPDVVRAVDESEPAGRRRIIRLAATDFAVYDDAR